MKIDVVDTKGNKVKDLTLDDSVFAIEPNKEALGQYLRVYLTNQTQGTSKTKTRSEVRGGGKKPWRQKGTGRARHGSIRSPIWVGGGVAHGPQPVQIRKTLPKKIRVLAIKSALSQRVKDKAVVLVDKLDVKSMKTKDVVKLLSKLLSDRKNLIVWKERDENLLSSVNNLPSVSLREVYNLNAYELLDAKKIIMVEDAAKYLEEKYKK